MKKVIFKSFAILSIATLLGSCGQKTEELATEAPEYPKAVCAKYSNAWYTAEAMSENDGKIHVKYYDGVESDLASDEVKELLMKDDVKVNDRVLAIWAKSSFYEGTVSEVSDNGAMVVWDDGSTPKLVAYGQLAKGFPKSNKQTFAASSGAEVCVSDNGSYLQAKILSEKDGIAHVILYNDTEKDFPSASVISTIRDLKQIKVKDNVYAIWAANVYYPGEVVSIEKDGLIVRWQDGTKPSFVKAGQFIKKP